MPPRSVWCLTAAHWHKLVRCLCLCGHGHRVGGCFASRSAACAVYWWWCWYFCWWRVVPWCCVRRVDPSSLSWVLRTPVWVRQRARQLTGTIEPEAGRFRCGGGSAADRSISTAAVLWTVPTTGSSSRSRQILLRRRWLRSCAGHPVSDHDESAAFALNTRQTEKPLTSGVSHWRSPNVGVIKLWTVCAVTNLASELAPAEGHGNSLEEGGLGQALTTASFCFGES